MSATIALALLAAAARAAPADVAGKARLQVAIIRQADSAFLTPEGEVRLVEPNGRKRALEWKGMLKLKPASGSLRLADQKLPSGIRLEPQDGSAVRVGNNRYRGVLILRLDSRQTVTVIEEIGLEDYLEGVLPHEMDPDWPLEALKAQAVVARTFAYANMGKFRKDGFDLTSDTRSQVYRGLSSVNANVRAAVRQTRGEVLGWKGKLLDVYYHSCCGGATENVAEAWGGDPRQTPRPLRGVKDPWCRNSPQMNWTAYFTWQDLMSAITERHNLPGPLTSFKIAHRSLSGYVLSFAARSGRSSVQVKSSELRSALGSVELKSTRILRLVPKKNGIQFVGTGSGHGVGLCQWGAKALAERGRRYEQILKFYFPGADLSEVDE